MIFIRMLLVLVQTLCCRREPVKKEEEIENPKTIDRRFKV